MGPDRPLTAAAAGSALDQPRAQAVDRWLNTLASLVQLAWLPLAVVAVIIILLEVAGAAGWLPITVPSPSQIANAFALRTGDLLFHATPTVINALAGYGLALTLALVLAAIATTLKVMEKPIFNLGVMVDSIPIIALAPILIIWLKNGQEAKIVVAMLAAQFPLLVGAIQGFKAVDRTMAELFHVLSASPTQRLVKLALPTALPYLFAACKVAAPLAVLGALFGDWAGGDQGIGMMMVYAMFSFDTPVVWMTILFVCGMALAGYALVAVLETIIIRWDTGGKVGG